LSVSEAASQDSAQRPLRLRDALRKARIDAASRTGVVVDLRDAELARLEILNEALDPLFAEIPDHIDLFDRGISQGEPPRLWIDAIAHVQMGRDKRLYRLVQDTRYGRTLMAESHDAAEMAHSVADYVARRMIEREQTLAGRPASAGAVPRRGGRWVPFMLGVAAGAGGVLLLALAAALRGF
jgi:hypothetical protein